MLTVTDELWIMAVMRNPMKIPKNGFFSLESRLMINGDSFRPAMLPDMSESPMNSTPKPRMTSPT